MADALTTLARRSPLVDLGPWPHAKTTLEELPHEVRYSFRGMDEAVQQLATALGLHAPAQNRAETNAQGSLIRLGPDEIYILGPSNNGHNFASNLAVVAGRAHSLVDISHRNFAFGLSGNKVEAVLAAGNPLDLHVSAFPVGMATRTLLGKAEIVLWRQAQDRFRIDCWRSFAPYIREFLVEAAREYK
jgi:sarcosine oxidase, subunit gamma